LASGAKKNGQFYIYPEITENYKFGLFLIYTTFMLDAEEEGLFEQSQIDYTEQYISQRLIVV
jgi:hypothetical protein